MRDDATLQFRLPAQKKAEFLAAVENQIKTETAGRSWWSRPTTPAKVLRQLVDDYIKKHPTKPEPEAKPKKPAKKRAEP